MSEGKENGGPAFPYNVITGQPCHSGLTKREWFAGMAPYDTVKLAAQRYMDAHKVKTCTESQARFFYADEMIAEGRGS